jgi:hypothetical protein
MRTSNNAVVAIYKSPAEVETTVEELQQSGFDMKKLSIVGPDHHTDEAVIDYYNTGDKMNCPGKIGAAGDGAWGLLFGAAFILLTGIGPMFVAGPLVTWIVGGLESASVAGELNALGAVLYSLGFPKSSLLTALNSGKFVIIAHGDDEEATPGREIIIRHANRHAARERKFSRPRQEPGLAGAVIVGTGDLSTVGAGLHGIGVPKDNLPRYETALKSSKFVMIAHVEETTRIRGIISRINPEVLEEYQSSTSPSKARWGYTP